MRRSYLRGTSRAVAQQLALSALPSMSMTPVFPTIVASNRSMSRWQRMASSLFQYASDQSHCAPFAAMRNSRPSQIQQVPACATMFSMAHAPCQQHKNPSRWVYPYPHLPQQAVARADAPSMAASTRGHCLKETIEICIQQGTSGTAKDGRLSTKVFLHVSKKSDVFETPLFK